MSVRPPLSPEEVAQREAAAKRYDWLHNDDAAVADWAQTQHGIAERYLAALPHTPAFRESLHEILTVDVRELPVVRGDRSFQLRRAAGEQQFSLWVTDADGDRLLIDARTIGSAQDSISTFEPSPDGSKVAWAVSAGGADWMVGRFRDAVTGVDDDDVLNDIKWPSFAWLDNQRIAYMSWGAPVVGQELLARNDDASVHMHTLRTSQHDDVEIYRPAKPAWSAPKVSGDGKWITIQVSEGTTPAHVFRKSTSLDGEWQTVVSGAGPDMAITVVDDETYIFSYSAGPAGVVLAYGADAQPRTVYAAPATAPIDQADVIGRHLVVLSHPLTGSELRVQPLDGGASDAVTVTFEVGTRIYGFGAGKNDASVLVDIERIGGTRRVVELPFDGNAADLNELVRGDAEWRTTLVEVESNDGTLVPMFVVHAPGYKPDGNAKVFLAVYGGYGVHFLAHGYSAWHLAWLRAGGVVAYAGVRGGSEHGESWHQAATFHQKQNGVDDLVACAEWFEKAGWSQARSVALNGMSNGGMMVSIALTQSPASLGAAIPEVPVADMLNFHRYTVGHGWICEFGDPDIAEDRAVLASYSPLHNVRADVDYPPTLILTADKDDRVPPGPHAYKLAAALSDVIEEPEGVLLRVEADAGHAIGRSLQAEIDERSAVLGFAAASLGLASPQA